MIFEFDVLKNENIDNIYVDGKKTLKPIKSKNRADKFCDYGNSNEKIEFPNLCGINFRNTKYKKPINSFGFMAYEQNPVRGNSESVYLQVGVGHRNRGVFINEKNIFDVLSVFTAKRLIIGDFVNWYDEYEGPKTDNDVYQQFKIDSLIYSLFNSKSLQSSLTFNINNIDFDINNEFFWMSPNRIKQLADESKYDEVYNDCRLSNDPYMYKLLFGDEYLYNRLSEDSRNVLNKAIKLVEKSIEVRQVTSNDINQLHNWDAGYVQLKVMWKELFNEDFKIFRQLYKKMEDRMRPLVYELGFLKK